MLINVKLLMLNNNDISVYHIETVVLLCYYVKSITKTIYITMLNNYKFNSFFTLICINKDTIFPTFKCQLVITIMTVIIFKTYRFHYTFMLATELIMENWYFLWNKNIQKKNTSTNCLILCYKVLPSFWHI